MVIHVRSQRAGQRVLAKVTRYVETALKLRVSETAGALARVTQRTFLGYRIDHRGVLCLSTKSRLRLIGKLRQLLRRARGRSLSHTLEVLNPARSGWAAYFRLAHSKSALQFIDGWICRKLRCILWRQWKRLYTCQRYQQRLAFPEQQTWKSAVNGRGPWWNAGATHMNRAMPKVQLDRWGLVSVANTVLRFSSVYRQPPPHTDPYVRWCGRTAGATQPPTRSHAA